MKRTIIKNTTSNLCEKYLDTERYIIRRCADAIYNWNKKSDINNVISITDIQKAIESLKTLTGVNEYTIKVKGFFTNSKQKQECDARSCNVEIEIISNNKIKLYDTEYKVNIIEYQPAINGEGWKLDETTYFDNMIDEIIITWNENEY
jgi:predicted translin family RNA/ssDNA-binding protein